MHKLLFFLCSLLALACTNRAANTGSETNDSTGTVSTTVKPPMNEDEMRFLSGCVENAKIRYTEAQAFTLCKCMLAQVQQRYPSADSATILQHLSDTAEVAKMVRNCNE